MTPEQPKKAQNNDSAKMKELFSKFESLRNPQIRKTEGK